MRVVLGARLAAEASIGSARPRRRSVPSLGPLLQEVEWLKVDEAAIEAVHRDAAMVNARAHGVCFAGAPAEIRLAQNGAVWQETRAVGARATVAFARCWRRWKAMAADSPAAAGGRPR